MIFFVYTGDIDPNFHDELKAIKTNLESVQGTLITSVGLIQDQLDQFSTQMTSSIDSRYYQIQISRLFSLTGKILAENLNLK